MGFESGLPMCRERWLKEIRLQGSAVIHGAGLAAALWTSREKVLTLRLWLRFAGLSSRDGEPIEDFRKAFDTAADAAGIKGILVHDVRRSAVRNFIRAGIKETVAMTMSGYRTGSIYDRYEHHRHRRPC